VKWPTLHQRKAVWRGILDDQDAREALATLKQDGFPIDDLSPPDSRQVGWADYIASIPFLPNRPSRRQLHPGRTLRKHLPLVNALRQFAAEANDPFCEIRVITKNEILLEGSRNFGKELGQAADLIEKFISSDWSTRNRNPRNAVIASLRWMIRHRTGAPHDSELAVLIDAALSAVGKSCIFLDPHTLERIEKREREGRVKAACRLNYLSGKSPSPLPSKSLSTRFPRNRKKRV
jgi:hypothetical protein